MGCLQHGSPPPCAEARRRSKRRHTYDGHPLCPTMLRDQNIFLLCHWPSPLYADGRADRQGQPRRAARFGLFEATQRCSGMYGEPPRRGLLHRPAAAGAKSIEPCGAIEPGRCRQHRRCTMWSLRRVGRCRPAAGGARAGAAGDRAARPGALLRSRASTRSASPGSTAASSASKTIARWR